MTHPLVGWLFLSSRQRREVRSELPEGHRQNAAPAPPRAVYGRRQKERTLGGIPHRTGSGSTPMPAAPRLSVQEGALPGVTSRLGVVISSGLHELRVPEAISGVARSSSPCGRRLASRCARRCLDVAISLGKDGP